MNNRRVRVTRTLIYEGDLDWILDTLKESAIPSKINGGWIQHQPKFNTPHSGPSPHGPNQNTVTEKSLEFEGI